MIRRALTLFAAIALVTLLLAGCGAEDQMSELTANPWVATQIQTSAGMGPTLQGSSPAVYFNPDGTVTGNATVNSFKGPYTVNARNIAIGPLVVSDWDAPQMESTQDQTVLDALKSAARYHIKDGVMQLSDASGNLLMSLTVAQEPKLVGPVWKCTACLDEKGELASTIGTSQVVAEFAPDGELKGSTGVNQYSAAYTVSGTNMTIGPDVSVTKTSGPEALMVQEARYLAAITRTAGYRIEAYSLTLTDAQGVTVATYVPLAPKQ